MDGENVRKSPYLGHMGEKMKEKLYNIPVNDAVNADSECPICYIERAIEQDMMDFVLGSGSSYMESDVREQTDKAGFCRVHFKKMYDYGNTLGNAWIMKTHMKRMNEEAARAFDMYKPGKNGLTALFKKEEEGTNSVTEWVKSRESSCYICNGLKEHYDRYLKTFFEMYDKDPSFKERIINGKGFCLPHFSDLLEYAGKNIPENRQQAFADEMIPLMKKQMEKLYGDVSWLVEKFDYRNKDADWGDSKEALQNCMQRLKGGFPADPAYKAKK